MATARTRRRRILVTGGSGFLGTHVVARGHDEFDVLTPASGDLDVRHRDAIVAAVREFRPDAIIHTAYRRDCRATLVDGSQNIAEAAAGSGARLVHVSTDALFAGRNAAYTEADHPDPVHDYGRDKSDAESAVARLMPDAAIIRTSLILGAGSGVLSSHERTVARAIDGDANMEFFTDEVRTPVRVDDLAAALVAIATTPAVQGVLNLGGPDPMSRADLAMLVAHHHGWDGARLRFSTIERSGLHRPANVVLDSRRSQRYGLQVRGPTSWRS